MKKGQKWLVALSLAAFGSQLDAGNDFEPAMANYLEGNIVAWAQDPVIIDAIRAANAVTAGYSADQGKLFHVANFGF